jgi:hypothetical protein
MDQSPEEKPSRKHTRKLEPLRSMPIMLIILVLATLFVIKVPFHIILIIISQAVHGYRTIATPFLDGWLRINDILLFSHIAAAVPCIIFGPLLFYRDLLKVNPALHRKIGTYYVYGVLYSAVTVIPLSMSKLHILPQTGFTVMAVVWFCVTWLGFMAARNKNFVTHRRWMMRSYAMSFAFIHVNLTYHWIGIYEMMDGVSIKVMQSMVSWQFNLFVVEIYLAATTFKGKFVGWKQWAKNLTRWAKDDRFFLWPPKKSAEAA